MLNVQLKKLDPMIGRMQRRYRAMTQILSSSRAFRIGPHNDPEAAAGLHVIFGTAQDAQRFAAENKRGVYRLFDSSRHVYTNWQPVIEQRAFHREMNAFAWADRKMDYSPDVCARSLDILQRTCRISLGENYPLPLVTALARRMVRHQATANGFAHAVQA
jgi:hypothetical protein